MTKKAGLRKWNRKTAKRGRRRRKSGWIFEGQNRQRTGVAGTKFGNHRKRRWKHGFKCQ